MSNESELDCEGGVFEGYVGSHRRKYLAEPCRSVNA